MKHLLYVAALALLLPLSSYSEDTPAPKPLNAQSVRVLLYVSGSERCLDYTDVSRVLCSEPLKIVFETLDGYLVVHQGAYTVIQSKPAFAEHQARGVKFYDVK